MDTAELVEVWKFRWPLRINSLSWTLIYAWIPWMAVQSIRGFWVFWTLLPHRSIMLATIVTLIWVFGKLWDESMKPTKEPLQENR